MHRLNRVEYIINMLLKLYKISQFLLGKKWRYMRRPEGDDWVNLTTFEYLMRKKISLLYIGKRKANALM